MKNLIFKKPSWGFFVILLSVIYTFFMTRHTIALHNQYMQMIDFSAYDQVVWSLSKRLSFESSICGSIMNFWNTIKAESASAAPAINASYNALGIHFIPSIFVTNSLPNLMYDSPNTTYFMQTLAFSSSAVMLFYILVYRSVSPWIAAALSFSFLIHPANVGANVNAFHPVVMSLPFIFILFHLGTRGKSKLYWLLFLFVGFFQENLWITLSAFTLIFLQHRKWKFAAANLLVGLTFLVMTTQVFIPFFNADHVCPYCSVYGSPLGGSMGQIIKNAILKPEVTWGLVSRPEVLQWLNQLLRPTFYLVIFNPSLLLIAIAGVVPNILSTNSAMHIMWGQYSALAMPFIYIGAGLGFGFLQRKLKFFKYSWFWSLVLVWSSMSAAKDWAVSNTTKLDVIFTTSPQNFANPEMLKAYDFVKAQIPPEASVSATELFLNSVGRRPSAFLFPVGSLKADFVIVEKANLTISKENYSRGIKDLAASNLYELKADDNHVQLWVRKK
jgi:uncharacterized membrane protein